MNIATLLRYSALTASLSLVAVAAQGQGCVITTEKPAEIIGARATYGRLIDAQGKEADKKMHFTKSVQKLVEEWNDIPNQIARYYMLGRFYAAWLSMGEVGRPATPEAMFKKAIVTRGEAGFTLGDKKLPHDLFAAMDSAFNKVEELGGAGCADSTGPYRERVYSVVYNEAKRILTLRKYDSTVVLAKRALVAAPKAFAPWNLIGQAYFEKGDEPAYRAALLKIVTLPARDSITIGIQQRAHYNLAAMSLRDAKTKDGDTKKALAKDAEDHFRESLKLKQGDPIATSGLVGALVILGDTAAARTLSDNMLRNPDQFSALALFEAASNSFNSGEYATALKFYEAGVKKNPYFRDGLFSMVSTLLKLEQYDRSIETMRKVFALDPNNRENFQQMASALQGAERMAKEKGTRTDSILYYALGKDSLPAYTKIEKFEVTGDSISLVGVVHNLTAATRSQHLDFEFLSAAGAVVGTASIDVTDIPAKTGKRYNLDQVVKGAAAWRYKPFKQ